MAPSTFLPPTPEPLEAVRTLRIFLEQVRFVEPVLCERLGLDTLFDFRSRRAGRDVQGEPADAIGALVHLFMDGERMSGDRAAALLGDQIVAVLRTLRLLVPVGRGPMDEKGSGPLLGAGALMYPVGSLRIASDVNPQAPGASDPDAELSDEAVYPALADANRGFLRDLPTSPVGGDALDLCSGTGIAALRTAPLAERAWATDITDRATDFVRFNAALNGLDNVEAVTGDLWDAVGNHRFNRITAHPPYLPALDGDHVFRDGGADGERLLREIVRGLPAHLEPGGVFYGHGMGTDRVDAPLEQRLAALLGDRRLDFRVALLWTRMLTPAEFAWSRVRSGRASADDGARHLQVLLDHGVERFVQGSVLIERRVAGEPRGRDAESGVVRRPRGDGGGWPAISRFMERRRWWESEGHQAGPGGLRPRLASDLEIEMRYRRGSDGMAPVALRLHTVGALPVSAGVPPALAPVLELFDGTRTPAEILEKAVKAGALPEGVPPDEFESMVASLLEEGVLEVDRNGGEG